MSTSNNLILYTSPEIQSETGLYYYGAHYLDPKTSRWLSGDLLDLVWDAEYLAALTSHLIIILLV